MLGVSIEAFNCSEIFALLKVSSVEIENYIPAYIYPYVEGQTM